MAEPSKERELDKRYQELCGRIYGPMIHGAQHRCIQLVGHPGNCQCACGKEWSYKAGKP